MNKRQLRQEAIRDLTRSHHIFTQTEMTELLQEAGYECTQATVSRDIVELGLEKTSGKFYILPEELRLRRVAPELVKSAQAAGNLVVVKTRPGGAGGVAEAIDAALLVGLIGSVAGDDTILLVIDTPEHAQILEKTIMEYAAC